MTIPTIRNTLHFLAPIAIAGAVGFGWGESPAYLVAAFLLFLAWGMCTSRVQTFFAVLAYYLVTARGVPTGGALFFDDAVRPTLIWLGVSAVLATVWALGWTQDWKQYWWRLLAIQLLITVPPLGQLAVGNPLTGAGMLFPGWGFFGYTCAFICGVLLAQHGRAPSTHKLSHYAGIAVLAGLVIALGVYGPAYQPELPAELVGISTTQGTPERLDFFKQFFVYQNNTATVSGLLRKGSKLVVLPESSTGAWNRPTQNLWTGARQLAEAKHAVVVTGAALERGSKTDNVMVIMDGAQTKFYRVRMPVPFRDRGLESDRLDSGEDLSSNSIIDTKAGKLGMFICYEVLLPWSVLTTASQHPDVLVAGINGWWAPEGNSIPGLQRSVLQSWARLFGIPGVAALNRS